uniref:Uncharacterized protein n=1 Tax=Cucumis melo TaxID=3656 RepID=A0A9I9D4Z8_CUCME
MQEEKRNLVRIRTRCKASRSFAIFRSASFSIRNSQRDMEE